MAILIFQQCMSYFCYVFLWRKAKGRKVRGQSSSSTLRCPDLQTHLWTRLNNALTIFCIRQAFEPPRNILYFLNTHIKWVKYCAYAGVFVHCMWGVGVFSLVRDHRIPVFNHTIMLLNLPPCCSHLLDILSVCQTQCQKKTCEHLHSVYTAPAWCPPIQTEGPLQFKEHLTDTRSPKI